MRKTIIFSLFLLLVVVLSACTHTNMTADAVGSGQQVASGEVATFAQCLTESGAAMYGADWCPHCNNQKAMFGDAWQHINYVECERNRQACTQAGIQGYPTWIIEGKPYPGEASFEKLSRLSGCELDTTTA